MKPDLDGRLPEWQRESEQKDFIVRFPDVNGSGLPQDAEYCWVEQNGETRRIRFHDYHEIYTIPGLYESIFYDLLACQSPAVLGMLLEHEVRRSGQDMASLRVLDVGAGNGIMGETLRQAGADRLVGVDILPEAAQAAERDRPGVYDAYYPVDLLHPPRDVLDALQDEPFNTLTLVAALGFGDIPPAAFLAAFRLVLPGGFVAFNLRDRFLERDDASGFAQLVHTLLERGALEELVRVRYVHRLSVTGEPLFYTGVIGRKGSDPPGGASVLRQDN